MTIKHTQHQVAPPEGSDTWRHWRAGAKTTVLLGRKVTIVTRNRELALLELVAGEEQDYVIIEGMKNSDLPKIWCLRDDEPEPPESAENVVAWFRSESGASQHNTGKVSIFTPEDVSAIVDVVEHSAIDAERVNQAWRTSKA